MPEAKASEILLKMGLTFLKKSTNPAPKAVDKNMIKLPIKAVKYAFILHGM